MRKEPFAKERALLTNHFVQRHADLMREPHVHMVAIDGNPFGFEERGERAKLDRSILRVAERHVDERRLSLLSHLLSCAFMARDSGS